MPKKGKKRREAQRIRKQEKVAAEQEALSPEEEAARLARARAKAEHEAERLRRKRKAAAGGDGLAMTPLFIGAPVLLIVVVAVGLFLVLSGGGGGANPTPVPTVDPRIRNLTPTASLEIQANGDADNAFYVPATLTVKAGEVFQINITNNGTVTHNLVIAGVDGEFDTRDDWESMPFDIKVGEQGVVTAKLDTPGTYPFHCSFHPTVQIGTLIVQ